MAKAKKTTKPKFAHVDVNGCDIGIDAKGNVIGLHETYDDDGKRTGYEPDGTDYATAKEVDQIVKDIALQAELDELECKRNRLAKVFNESRVYKAGNGFDVTHGESGIQFGCQNIDHLEVTLLHKLSLRARRKK